MTWNRKRLADVVGVVASLSCLGAGLALSPACDGGITLLLFGGAVASLGLVLYHEGALAPIVLVALITLTLVAGGLYGASAAGCVF